MLPFDLAAFWRALPYTRAFIFSLNVYAHSAGVALSAVNIDLHCHNFYVPHPLVVS